MDAEEEALYKSATAGNMLAPPWPSRPSVNFTVVRWSEAL